MTKQERLLAKLHCILVSEKDHTIRGLSWKEYKKFAGLTRHINYDCKFHGNTCKAERVNGCCGGCFNSVGYWRAEWSTGQISKDHLEALVKYWDDKTGFLRNSGCVLPRKYRSPTCLGFTCMCTFTSEGEALMTLLSGRCTDFYGLGKYDVRRMTERAYQKIFGKQIHITDDDDWRAAMRAIKRKAMEIGK